MQISNLLFLFLLCCLGCKNSRKEEPKHGEVFDKIKWAEKKKNSYPYRDKMLNDFIMNYKIHGIKKDSLLKILGQPDRSDNGHLFYTVAQERLGLIPLHTKTLVVKLTKDSTVEWRKIHE